MSVTVHCKDFHSDEARSLAELATAHLQGYFRRVISVSWMLVADHGDIVARCELHARSGRFFGSGRSAELGAAIHEASDRITRQRRRQKRMAGRMRPALQQQAHR